MDTRRAIDSDLKQLSTLFDKYRQFYGKMADLEGAQSFVGERLALNDSAIFVAVSDASLVGFVQLYPSLSSVSMARIYILNDLFVETDYRKKGVGTSLIRAAEKYGNDQKAIKMALATAVTNDAARALYESLGWVKDDDFFHYNLTLPI